MIRVAFIQANKEIRTVSTSDVQEGKANKSSGKGKIQIYFTFLKTPRQLLFWTRLARVKETQLEDDVGQK